MQSTPAMRSERLLGVRSGSLAGLLGVGWVGSWAAPGGSPVQWGSAPRPGVIVAWRTALSLRSLRLPVVALSVVIQTWPAGRLGQLAKPVPEHRERSSVVHS